MKHESFIEHLELLIQKAKCHDETMEWIANNIGKGLRFGETVEDECGKIIFTVKGTPARSPERLLSCLLMTVLIENNK